jgi:hypothetical protein
MPRQLRIQYEDAIYHLMSRSVVIGVRRFFEMIWIEKSFSRLNVIKTFLTWRPSPGGIISMKPPTHSQIRAVAATAVFVLSLAAATATTTDVIFSLAEDEGEYADTDLETDSAGNIYGTTVLGGDFGSGTVFMLRPHSYWLGAHGAL